MLRRVCYICYIYTSIDITTNKKSNGHNKGTNYIRDGNNGIDNNDDKYDTVGAIGDNENDNYTIGNEKCKQQ